MYEREKKPTADPCNAWAEPATGDKGVNRAPLTLGEVEAYLLGAWEGLSDALSGINANLTTGGALVDLGYTTAEELHDLNSRLRDVLADVWTLYTRAHAAAEPFGSDDETRRDETTDTTDKEG